MSELVRNERRKLLATWYNNASLAIFVTGILAPFSTIIYGTSAPVDDDMARTIGFVVCIIVSGLLRYVAHSTLGSLEE